MKNENSETKNKVMVRLTDEELAQIKAAVGEPKASTAIMIAARKGAGIKIKARG